MKDLKGQNPTLKYLVLLEFLKEELAYVKNRNINLL